MKAIISALFAVAALASCVVVVVPPQMVAKPAVVVQPAAPAVCVNGWGQLVSCGGGYVYGYGVPQTTGCMAVRGRNVAFQSCW
ncbi:hypothetical protein HY972_01165 [Candidatus Kaiserbacteria bacterium]|nr:hypothetical protein [Candidatus Kaiserbacteria bacterium]